MANRNSPPENTAAAEFAVVRMLTLENMESAEFASVSWLMQARSRA